jgi:hypothetical protein
MCLPTDFRSFASSRKRVDRYSEKLNRAWTPLNAISELFDSVIIITVSHAKAHVFARS